MTIRHLFVRLSCHAVFAFLAAATVIHVRSQAGKAEIKLLVRGDDMGVAQAINEACLKSYRDGVVRSVEVIVPGPWFLDAARLLRQNPELDAGVHLCLTSEWERCKWRPLTHAASLVDADGYFFPMTSQRQGFPPHTAFLEAHPKLDEVEKELRAQIELARRNVPRISHLSAHMGAATATPELKGLVAKLAQEYKLRLENEGLRSAGGFGSNNPNERENNLLTLLENLQPGQWLLVEHPGLDTPEMRALGHLGYEAVAIDRAAVTTAFTSKRVSQVIQRRGIKLISYANLGP